MTTVSCLSADSNIISPTNVRGEWREKRSWKREMPKGELCHVVEKLAAKSTKWASSEAILKAEEREERRRAGERSFS